MCVPLIKDIAALFESINETFSTELTEKQTRLNTVEQSVRAATRTLAEKRQQAQKAQTTLIELEQLGQKIENVQRGLIEVESLDFTGRSDGATHPAFRALPPHIPAPITSGAGEEATLPAQGDRNALITLRRMKLWEDRISQVLQERISKLESESLDKEVKYRKLVSLCTKVPVDKVDGVSGLWLSVSRGRSDARCSNTSRRLFNQTGRSSILVKSKVS
jgi:regulatory protein SWI6